MVNYLYKKTLTSTLECGVFAVEKILLFFTKEIEFYNILHEISAANFILEGCCSRNFAFFIKKTVDLRRFSEKNLRLSK